EKPIDTYIGDDTLLEDSICGNPGAAICFHPADWVTQMSELNITYAGADYLDKTRALMTGRVRPRGVRLRLLDLPVSDLFRRVAQYDEFDAAEMSFSTFLNRMDRGDDRYVAIPVFPSRNFRHGHIFVNKSAGIRAPADLRGKRIGINDYQLTAAVWQRAFLQ